MIDAFGKDKTGKVLLIEHKTTAEVLTPEYVGNENDNNWHLNPPMANRFFHMDWPVEEIKMAEVSDDDFLGIPKFEEMSAENMAKASELLSRIFHSKPNFKREQILSAMENSPAYKRANAYTKAKIRESILKANGITE